MTSPMRRVAQRLGRSRGSGDRAPAASSGTLALGYVVLSNGFLLTRETYEDWDVIAAAYRAVGIEPAPKPSIPEWD